MNGRVPGLFAAATSEMVAVARELAGIADDEHRNALTDKLTAFFWAVATGPEESGSGSVRRRHPWSRSQPQAARV